MRSHQVSWIIHFGKIPYKLCVCHKCDNPSCVNPDHLFLGTISDNIKDAYNKGRVVKPPLETLPKGVNKWNAKLNDEIIKEIRARYTTEKISYRALAKIYKVNYRTIGDIIRKEKWKHVN